MTSKKFLTMYGTVCNADELVRIFEEIPELSGCKSKLMEKLEELENPEQLESASQHFDSNYQRFLTKASYQLIFRKNGVTYKIYILSDFEIYFATIDDGVTIESEILDAWGKYDEDEEGIWEVEHSGTKKLYRFLKSNKLIRKRTPEYTPEFYQVLDFSELYVTLGKYLLSGVELSLSSVMYPMATVFKLGKGLSMLEFMKLDNNKYFVYVSLQEALMSMEPQVIKSNFKLIEPAFSVDPYTLQEIANKIGISKWL